MFLWEPSTSQKPTARMTGHLQLINQVRRHAQGSAVSVCHGRCQHMTLLLIVCIYRASVIQTPVLALPSRMMSAL